MSDLDYIGVKRCGCIRTWCSSDNPPRHLARTIARWIREGLSVERCSTDEARQRIKKCPHDNGRLS